MSVIDSLVNNKTIRNALLGKLKEVIKSEGLQYIILSIDGIDGSLNVDMYKPGEVTFVIKPGIPETIKPETDAKS